MGRRPSTPARRRTTWRATARTAMRRCRLARDRARAAVTATADSRVHTPPPFPRLAAEQPDFRRRKRRAASRRRRGVSADAASSLPRTAPACRPCPRARRASGRWPASGACWRGSGRACGSRPRLGAHVTRRFFLYPFFLSHCCSRCESDDCSRDIAFFIAIARVWSSRGAGANARGGCPHAPQLRLYRRIFFSTSPLSLRLLRAAGPAPPPLRRKGFPLRRGLLLLRRGRLLLRALGGLRVRLFAGFAVGVGFGRVALGRLGRLDGRAASVAGGKVERFDAHVQVLALLLAFVQEPLHVRPRAHALAAGGVVVRVRAGDGFARDHLPAPPRRRRRDALRRVGGAPERLGGGARRRGFRSLRLARLDHRAELLGAHGHHARGGVQAVC